MNLDQIEDPLTQSEISKIVSYNSLDLIYKLASTFKDYLENRLKREIYIQVIVKIKETYYKIFTRGNKLLRLEIIYFYI